MYVMPKYGRLTDNDKTFGPVTIGERSRFWRPLAITLESGGEEYAGASLSLSAFGWTVRIAIPAIIKPWRVWVDTSRHNWAGSSGGYWDIHRREYGFRLSDGFLQIFHGAQTHDSDTDQTWCKHLPWMQWRFVGDRYYGLGGELVASMPRKLDRALERAVGWNLAYAMRDVFKANLPAVLFTLEDFDGTQITATCRIEESECHFGTGWFAWLSLFRKARVHRSMSIEFDNEVGYEKGSWKGGLMGTGIDLQPGELHESAMRRFCAAGVERKGRTAPLKFIAPAVREGNPRNVEPVGGSASQRAK